MTKPEPLTPREIRIAEALLELHIATTNFVDMMIYSGALTSEMRYSREYQEIDRIINEGYLARDRGKESVDRKIYLVDADGNLTEKEAT